MGLRLAGIGLRLGSKSRLIGLDGRDGGQLGCQRVDLRLILQLGVLLEGGGVECAGPLIVSFSKGRVALSGYTGCRSLGGRCLLGRLRLLRLLLRLIRVELFQRGYGVVPAGVKIDLRGQGPCG